jgi:hypothetical protein
MKGFMVVIRMIGSEKRCTGMSMYYMGLKLVIITSLKTFLHTVAGQMNNLETIVIESARYYA